MVTQKGLSTREITWLLAQEARGAAQAIRHGIELQARESVAPPESRGNLHSPLVGDVLDSFAALDGAMNLLGDLHSVKGSRHRGRIDVAALLYEVCPHLNITLNTERSTDVVGEEEGVQRMLQLLLTQTGGGNTATAQPKVEILREGDWVRITTALGPDAIQQSALELRWLSRMAVRAGARLEFTGHARSLLLPAEGAHQEHELNNLRLELDAAQEQGEVYARELAHVLSDAESNVANRDHDDVAQARWDAACHLGSALRFTLEAQRKWGHELARSALGLISDEAETDRSVRSSHRAVEGTELEKRCCQPFASLIEQQALRFHFEGSADTLLVAPISWLICEAIARAMPQSQVTISITQNEDDRTLRCRMIPDARITQLAQEQSMSGPPSRGVAPGCLGVGGALASEFALRAGGRLTQHMPQANEYELWMRLPR